MPTPSLTSTASASTQPPSTLPFSTDHGFIPGWTLPALATFLPTPYGLALSLPPNTPLTSPFPYGPGTITAQLYLTTGTALLYTQQSTTGGYLVTLDVSGTLTLYRTGLLLATATATPPTDGWWLLSFSATSTLTLSLNGDLLISLPEPAPLPAGTLTLLGTDGLLVHSLTLPQTLPPTPDLALSLPQPPLVETTPKLTFITPSPQPPTHTILVGQSASINGLPPGEPGGPACSWVYLYASTTAELRAAFAQNSPCAVIWLTAPNGFIYDITPQPSDLPNGVFQLITRNIWLIREETLQPVTLRLNASPTAPNNPRLFYVDLNSQLTLINLHVDNFGITSTARGGAIYSDNVVRLYRTSFSNNRAADGGAIGNLGILKVWNSTFTANSSIYGGAISNIKYTANPSQVGILSASCVTFQGNSAQQHGGAVIALPGGATTTITNSNFLNNTSLDSASQAFYNDPANPTANLTANWWNTPDGPAGGQTISGPANSAGFLPAVVDINACPRPPELVIPQALPPITPIPPPNNFKFRVSNEVGANWSQAELSNIFEAVRITGQALQLHMNNPNLTAADAFNRVMVDGEAHEFIYFYRGNGASSTVTVKYPLELNKPDVQVNVNLGGCQTFNSIPRVIVCNWSTTAFAQFPEHAFVHELGHVFNNRSILTSASDGTTGLLFAAVENTYKGTCGPTFANAFAPPSSCHKVTDINGENGVVMGIIVGNGEAFWARGERGWGSGPDNIFTPFQQHPPEVFPTDIDVTRVDETAADMFLNWVYRRVSDPNSTFRQAVPGTWSGYRNTTWAQNSPGSDDYTYPGDARHEWMNVIMSRIFAVKGW